MYHCSGSLALIPPSSHCSIVYRLTEFRFYIPHDTEQVIMEIQYWHVTGGRIDRKTHNDSIYCASIVSCGKNRNNTKPKHTETKLNLNQHKNLRSVHMCLCIIVHKYHTQDSRKQF